MVKVSKFIVFLGVALILITGVIHVIDAKDSFEDAIYKGWLFYANGLACLIAAFGIANGMRWGWMFGLFISAVTFLGYVASRTVGLPMIPPEPGAWLEPLGVASLVSEGLFILVFVKMILDNK